MTKQGRTPHAGTADDHDTTGSVNRMTPTDGESAQELVLPRAKWRPSARHYLFTFVGLFCIGSLTWYYLWDASRRREFEAAAKAAYERGEPVWFSEIQTKSVQEHQNGRRVFMRACDLERELLVKGRNGQSPGYFNYLLTLGSREDPDRFLNNFSQLTASDHQVIQAMLAETIQLRAELQRALEFPEISFTYDLATPRPDATLLPHVQQAREFTDLISAEIAAELHAGNTDAAIRLTHSQLQLGYVLANDPFVVTQMVRFANMDNGLQCLEELLGTTELSTEDIASFDQQLQQLGASIRLRDTVLNQRAMSMTTLKHLDVNTDIFGEPDNTWESIERFAFRNFEALRLPAQVKALEQGSRIAELVDTPGPAAGQELQAIEDQLLAADSLWESYAYLAGNFTNWRKRGLFIRQRILNARLALRVARFRNARGRLPESLPAIADEDFPEIPPGLLSGQPLVYQRLADAGGEVGFVIFDIGEDQLHGQADDEQERFTAFTVRDRDPSIAAPERPIFPD